MGFCPVGFCPRTMRGGYEGGVGIILCMVWTIRSNAFLILVGLIYYSKEDNNFWP